MSGSGYERGGRGTGRGGRKTSNVLGKIKNFSQLKPRGINPAQKGSQNDFPGDLRRFNTRGLGTRAR